MCSSLSSYTDDLSDRAENSLESSPSRSEESYVGRERSLERDSYEEQDFHSVPVEEDTGLAEDAKVCVVLLYVLE